MTLLADAAQYHAGGGAIGSVVVIAFIIFCFFPKDRGK